MELALSTSWNAFRHERAEELVSEVKELGFRRLELSFNLSEQIIQGVLQLFKKQEIKIASLHNFCPVPAGIKGEAVLPDHYSLASLDEDERQEALRHTKKTIDTACIFQSKAVVLHCGRVEIADKTRQLIDLYQRGLGDSRESRDLKNDFMKERADKAAPFFEELLRSLDELSAYAKARGIFLGIETRFYYREIPSLPEIKVIFEKFKGSNILYWHDTGHSQVRDKIGFEAQEEYLNLFSNNMLGVHLHDVVGLLDHQPAGKGEVDFKRLKAGIPSCALKVLEVHHPATAEELKQSKAFLENIFSDGN
ncbi:MAG: sugar phosphate isomerase/epimerase [Candidatus Omnitrophica bacterium]|nr:sugar phosphate isomerase/epimerase [Candidatus Omnitrophota bacterium]